MQCQEISETGEDFLSSYQDGDDDEMMMMLTLLRKNLTFSLAQMKSCSVRVQMKLKQRTRRQKRKAGGTHRH